MFGDVLGRRRGAWNANDPQQTTRPPLHHLKEKDCGMEIESQKSRELWSNH
jgi:hypothetical protein